MSTASQGQSARVGQLVSVNLTFHHSLLGRLLPLHPLTFKVSLVWVGGNAGVRLQKRTDIIPSVKPSAKTVMGKIRLTTGSVKICTRSLSSEEAGGCQFASPGQARLHGLEGFYLSCLAFPRLMHQWHRSASAAVAPSGRWEDQ